MTRVNCSALSHVLTALNGKTIKKVTHWGERTIFTDGTECTIEQTNCCSDGGISLDFENALPGFTFKYDAEIVETETDEDYTETVTDGENGTITLTIFNGECPANPEHVTLSVSKTT